MKLLKPLDMHAHVDTDIRPGDLSALDAYVLAMTRSLDQFEAVRTRSDSRTIWGVGVHPGLVRSQRAFSEGRFRELIQHTPIVGEVGLDAKSRVPFELQLESFRSILAVVEETPRIVSVHSFGATLEVIRELSRRPVLGIVLHWWLGSPALTEEAVRLGCYFSVPPAATGRQDILEFIPKSRLLPETDHPSGDRFGPHPRRPGNTTEVEEKFGRILGLSTSSARELFWDNLERLARQTGTRDMFGAAWRMSFEEVRELLEEQ